ncbi:MAG: hypothetical protein H7308_19450 [Chthonomonadaceae bacterium]|nr:hypothetical protein [Chthonomonadaceae bacterium]
MISLKNVGKVIVGFALLIGWGTAVSAQKPEVLKIKTELCTVNFENASAQPNGSEPKEKDWFTPLKKQSGKPSLVSQEPVFLVVEITNESKEAYTLYFPYQSRWLSPELKNEAGNKVPLLPKTKFTTVVDGSSVSATGGPEFVRLSPGGVYREAVCLNELYSLRRVGDYRLTTKVRFQAFREDKTGNELGVYSRKDGVTFTQETHSALRLLNFSRRVIEKRLSQYNVALDTSKLYSRWRQILVRGWLTFPSELAFPSWERYVSHNPCTELFDPLNQSPTLDAARLLAFIAGNEKCSVEDRYRAMGLLMAMRMKTNTLQLPEFSGVVSAALQQLEGHVPSVFDYLPFPVTPGD